MCCSLNGAAAPLAENTQLPVVFCGTVVVPLGSLVYVKAAAGSSPDLIGVQSGETTDANTGERLTGSLRSARRNLRSHNASFSYIGFQVAAAGLRRVDQARCRGEPRSRLRLHIPSRPVSARAAIGHIAKERLLYVLRLLPINVC